MTATFVTFLDCNCSASGASSPCTGKCDSSCKYSPSGLRSSARRRDYRASSGLRFAVSETPPCTAALTHPPRVSQAGSVTLPNETTCRPTYDSMDREAAPLPASESSSQPSATGPSPSTACPVAGLVGASATLKATLERSNVAGGHVLHPPAKSRC